VTVTRTPTDTPFPPGEAVAGRAAIVSAGLGGVQSIVGAIVAIITNDGAPALTFGTDHGVGFGLPPGVDQCPISGTTSKDCTGPTSGALTIALGADQCVVAGPSGGTAEFNGSITLNAAPSILNKCGKPPRFVNGAYAAPDLSVHFRGPSDEPVLDVTAELNGNFSLTTTVPVPACLITSLTLSLNGPLASTQPDGSGVRVGFEGAQVVIDQIMFNADCVPLQYRLTFNGNATFTPLPPTAPLLVALNGLPSENQFAVIFSNFVLKQNATTDPLTVEMSGGLTSDCFGGLVGIQTFAPVAVAAGQICPTAGQLNVTGTGMTMATVVYQDGMVQVTPSGGQAMGYSSCLAPELLMCPA